MNRNATKAKEANAKKSRNSMMRIPEQQYVSRVEEWPQSG